jgi:hypothetical protein
MKDQTKILLKRIFPLGVLMFAHRTTSSIKQKFAYSWFFKDWKNFKFETSKLQDHRFDLTSKEFYPVLHEKTVGTQFDRHYIYHPAWAARKLSQIRPEFHTDISSTLNFCTIVSAFVPIKFYDYRPAELHLSQLSSSHADLTALPFPDNSVQSLSCMHTVEHIGLGRYGDPIDPIGDLKAMSELQRVVGRGGNFLFVVPVGKPKVQFNAQRVYSFEQIMGAFSGLKLKEFSLIPDAGPIIENASPDLVKKQANGCGCFWFVKE